MSEESGDYLQHGPLKEMFISKDEFGGLSKGDIIAWTIAFILWIFISGGFFDDKSMIDCCSCFILLFLFHIVVLVAY